ncbi:MAG TPA: hypothetical protein VH684_01160 [Xanthobacteraceae bacterium]|jgi:hypothetical protein
MDSRNPPVIPDHWIPPPRTRGPLEAGSLGRDDTLVQSELARRGGVIKESGIVFE